MCCKSSCIVDLSFVIRSLFSIPFLFSIVPPAIFFSHYSNVAMRYRLAEEIICAHFYFGILILQIISTIWFGADREVRKIVATDLDRLIHLRGLISVLIQLGHNRVMAK